MHKSLIWIFFISLSSIHCYSQGQYKGLITSNNSQYYTKRIITLRDGGYVTEEVYTDTATYSITGKKSIFLTKFNACHQVLWSKELNPWEGTSYTDGLDLIQTTDKGFLLLYGLGNTPQPDSILVKNYPPMLISKLDSNGNIKWSKQTSNILLPNGIGWTPILQSVGNTSDRGYILYGIANFISRNGGVPDSLSSFLIKIDSLGNLIWSKKYSPMGTRGASWYNYYFEKVLPLKDGGFLFYLNESILCKVNSLGNIIWQKNLNLSLAISGPKSFGQDNSQNIYLSGSFGSLLSFARPFLLKIDNNGKSDWFYEYSDSIGLEPIFNADLQITEDGKIGLLNYPEYTSTPHLYILRTDQSGNILSNKLYQSNTKLYGSESGGLKIASTSDSGLVFIGPTAANNNTTICKMDKNGYSGCGETDVPLVIGSPFLQVINMIPSSYTNGFGIRDTTIAIKTIKQKAKVICSDHLIPQADISPDTVLCSAASYTLHKGAQNAGAKTYWSTGDTTDSIVVTRSGKYWLQLSHGYCTSSDTVTVIFKSEIFTGLPKRIFTCIYDSGWIYPQDTVANYYWIKPDKDTVQGRGVYLNDSGNYYLRINGTKSCAAMDTLHIAYWTLPDASAGPDTTLCYNETYTMQGSGGVTYTWHPATYLSSSTDPKAIAQLPNTERYELIVRNAQGCIDSSPVLLKVRPPLKPKAMVNNASVCYGQTIILSATATGGDSLHYQFNWNPDNLNGDSITEKVYQSGWHKITLSDNCSAQNATDSVYVTVIPPPKAAFANIPATKIKANHNISFLNQSTNASSYLWTFGTKDSSRLVSPVYVYTDTGDYQVILVAYGINNCTNDTAYGFIKIISDQITIYIPNAFSPNGDGINDVFDISGVGIKSYSYNIYNRWGENIYNGTAAWDGNFKSGQVPDGVYIYMFDITDVFGEHHYLNGNVTLMR